MRGHSFYNISDDHFTSEVHSENKYNTDILIFQCSCKLNKSNDNILKSKENYTISKELKS